MIKKARYTWKMQGELLSYYASDGVRLNGFLARSGTANRQAIVNVFGMGGDFFTSSRYPALCRALKGSGTDLFLANNRGMSMAARFGRRRGERILRGTSAERFDECIFDIKGAIDLLSSMGYRAVILQGHSTGAQKVIYYMRKTADRRVKGIVLLGPGDDYNLARRKLGRRFNKAVMIARAMVSHRKGHLAMPHWSSEYSASRFLSYADLKNVEARIFDYDGPMREFSGIKVPVLAVFGSKEQYALKPVRKYLEILAQKTKSKSFAGAIVKGGDHSFCGREDDAANLMAKWLSRI